MEYGLGGQELPRTVLCEWNKTESWVPERPSDLEHLNYGDGPEPTLEAFFRVVCSFIE